MYFNFDYVITRCVSRAGAEHNVHRARAEGGGITVGPEINDAPFSDVEAAHAWLARHAEGI